MQLLNIFAKIPFFSSFYCLLPFLFPGLLVPFLSSFWNVNFHQHYAVGLIVLQNNQLIYLIYQVSSFLFLWKHIFLVAKGLFLDFLAKILTNFLLFYIPQLFFWLDLFLFSANLFFFLLCLFIVFPVP